MTDHELERLLSLTDPGELRRLYDDAYQMKLKYIGKKVSIRGLIEISNICRKNCYYCGIRSGNRKDERVSDFQRGNHRNRIVGIPSPFCVSRSAVGRDDVGRVHGIY